MANVVRLFNTFPIKITNFSLWSQQCDTATGGQSVWECKASERRWRFCEAEVKLRTKLPSPSAGGLTLVVYNFVWHELGQEMPVSCSRAAPGAGDASQLLTCSPQQYHPQRPSELIKLCTERNKNCIQIFGREVSGRRGFYRSRVWAWPLQWSGSGIYWLGERPSASQGGLSIVCWSLNMHAEWQRADTCLRWNLEHLPDWWRSLTKLCDGVCTKRCLDV
jgi:hypothetical protein